jgi:hypothetical protein
MALPFHTTLAFAAPSANNISASQSPGAGAILINGSAATAGVATLDAARRVLLTSGGDDTSRTFTITGTSASGSPLVETIAGGNPTSYTTQDFKTITGVTHSGTVAGTLTVGTNQVASGPWYMPDRHLTPMTMGVAVVVSGTINYTVEYTFDNPNNPYTGTFPTVFPLATMTSQTTNQDSTFTTPFYAVRVTQNSFTNPGTAKAVFIQSGLGVQS